MEKFTKTSIFKWLRYSDQFFLFFFAPLVGLFVGFAALAFHYLIHLFLRLFFEEGKYLLSGLGYYYVILIPAMGGLIVGPITYWFARETRGHGVPEVMASVIKEGGRIRGRVGFFKIITASITIGSGGSAGPEGPIVHIGSAIGSWLGQIFKMTEERIKILLACGAASGIAATFNAPLGGTFFALEVILRDYGPRNISAVILSSVIATSISRRFAGDHPAFQIPLYQLQSSWELLWYILLGLLSAIISILFIKILSGFEIFFESIKIPDYLKPFVGGLLIGIIGFLFPEIFGGRDYQQIQWALDGKVIIFGLPFFLIFLKIIATSITLGSGGSGGVFAPSLFVGAMLGNAFGQMTRFVFPAYALNPGASAIVGMAGVFAGSSQAPISAILILFEMTNDYGMILPLMIACILSTLSVQQFLGVSIYTIKLRKQGIDIEKVRGLDLMEDIKISDVMFKNIVTVETTQPVREAGLKIKETGHRGFPVLGEGGKLFGIITRKDINRALDTHQADLPVQEFMSKKLIVCYPDQSLRTALEKLGRHGIGRLPVVDRKTGDFLGLITRKGIISGYNWGLQEKEKKMLSNPYSAPRELKD